MTSSGDKGKENPKKNPSAGTVFSRQETGKPVTVRIGETHSRPVNRGNEVKECGEQQPKEGTSGGTVVRGSEGTKTPHQKAFWALGVR